MALICFGGFPSPQTASQWQFFWQEGSGAVHGDRHKNDMELLMKMQAELIWTRPSDPSRPKKSSAGGKPFGKGSPFLAVLIRHMHHIYISIWLVWFCTGNQVVAVSALCGLHHYTSTVSVGKFLLSAGFVDGPFVDIACWTKPKYANNRVSTLMS